MTRKISALLLLVMVLSLCLSLVSCGVKGKTYVSDSVEFKWAKDTTDEKKAETRKSLIAMLKAANVTIADDAKDKVIFEEMSKKFTPDTKTYLTFNDDGTVSVKYKEDGEATPLGNWTKDGKEVTITAVVTGAKLVTLKTGFLGLGGLSTESEYTTGSGLVMVSKYKKA